MLWPRHGRTLVIKVGNALDISDHEQFRLAYVGASDQIQTYVVDFSQTRWVDSSVVGMLLLLRKFAGNDRKRIYLMGAGYKVRVALDAVNINALFTTDTQELPDYPALHSVPPIVSA